MSRRPPTDMGWTSFGPAMRVFYAVLCGGGTQWVMVSAATAENRMGNAHGGLKQRLPHAPTAIGGIADGACRSTADTL